MATVAVIQTGGKQYFVREGQELEIEKLSVEEGTTVDFDVMLLALFSGLMVLGFFDHYLFSLYQGQALFWICLGLIGRRGQELL